MAALPAPSRRCSGYMRFHTPSPLMPMVCCRMKESAMHLLKESSKNLWPAPGNCKRRKRRGSSVTYVSAPVSLFMEDTSAQAVAPVLHVSLTDKKLARQYLRQLHRSTTKIQSRLSCI